MKKATVLSKVFLFMTAVVFLFSACHRHSEPKQPDPGFTRYISSITSGEISVAEPVVIRLKQVPPEFNPEKLDLNRLFSLKPEVKGKVVYKPEGEFYFIPDKWLASGKTYTVDFLLGNVTEVDKAFRKLQFSFQTRKQDFSLEEDGLEAEALPGAGFFRWKGIVRTADRAAGETVQEMVKARYNGKPVHIEWLHGEDQLSHTLAIDSLERDQDKPRELKVEWEGDPIGARGSGKIVVNIPGRSGFSILGSKVVNAPEQRITVTFSDPLDPGQSPVGLAELGGNTPFVWQIESNRLTLWPSEKITGESSLTLYRGFRGTEGKSLPENVVIPLNFRNFNPGVRLLGKGVIVPDQGSMQFPFEAVSLNAVDLRIIKIYASNIRQFLQDNQVDGDNELLKVGRLVYKGKVELHPPREADLYKWSTYRLELNKYIQPEQGAVYRVELRFKKAYALYACGTGNAGGQDSGEEEEIEEKNMWDGPGWYSLYYWPDDYNWKERDNPCHNSYYTSNRFVARNIFASNLGILAKEGKGFRYTFVVTALDKATPEDKVEISLFDFQHQAIGKCSTDGNGMASITLERKPFVAVAKKGNQTGYLRLDDGSSLSLSNFDVSGETVQEGVKGFIYGERGVWRPGDRLYLTFILDDPEERLPENIPVILKITNSRGQEVTKRVATGSENGFYHFPVETSPDDPTGNWYARIQVGGATFEKRLKIETVKPNRLKIDLQLPALIQAGTSRQAPLRAEWLHGAVASSLKAVVEAEIFPEKTTFKGYEKYHFDHPGVTWSPTKQVLFDGRLDASGISAVPLGFPASASYPGKMKAFFTTRVFEEGGDFSINVQQAAFSPYKKYLGIRMPDEEDGWYSTGKNYLPEVIALTPEGTPASLGKVEVSLFKIDWRWWWESGDDYLARYVSGNNYQPLKRWSLQSSAMSEKLNLTVDYHNWNDNGRYLLYARDLESGQACGVTFYMSEWGGWRADALPDGATILAITTEKEKYATGEKMKVKIPSAPGSRALVSLEDGSSVKDIFWVNCSSNETAFEVDIKEGMAPTLYIYVTLIQPYGSAQNDAPIRLYGVHHVTVEDPATLLHPEIRMNEELEPEKEFTVNIKEQHGNPMTYTIAVVDEGLLDLTGFKTPDPHAGFYAREALGVLTWDMFDYVAGAYGARLEKAFAVGGDEERLMAGRKQANRFQPVVLYAGPFTLGKGASRTHQFKMPAYVGSVKAMVVAGSSGAWGNAEKTAKVRKSVMLLTTAPRMAGPGEEFSLPVEVFAMKENTRNVTVSISGNELVIPEGNTTQTLSFDQPGSKIVRFKVRTSPRTGIGRIRINAQSGSESSVQETELEIRNPNPPVVDEKDKLLNSRESWSTEMDLPGMSGTNSAVLELSTVPGLNLSGRLQELIAYPHGCAEQTVSVALGQLYLGNLTALSDETKVQTETNIKAAIQQLRGMQTSTGGFSIWPGQNNADDWCSSYAGHFLLLAAQKGYAIPEDMKKRWTAFQVSRARVWKPAVNAEPFIRHQENLVQAYRLYTLALAGAPETGVMNRFREEITGSPDARWRLAAAYFLLGQSAAANQLITLMPEGLTAYEPEGITYGSPLRDKAMILETLVLKNDRKAAFKVVAEMASEIGSSPWLSTQTAAWSFYAIARYFGNGTTGQGIQATVTLNGKKENVTSGNAVLRLPVSLNGNSSVKAAVTNEGQGTLYARLVSRGIPLEDKTPEVQRNLRVETLFTDRNGQPLNPASLPQGSDLFIQVTVSHPGIKGKYRNLALTTIFPSGWEILNSRIQDVPAAVQANFDYQDIRDDRVYTYFDLRPAETKKFRFALHAAYAGKYTLPAIVAEGMYDNEIYARIPGARVEVK